MMEDRKRRVLQAIIDDYIHTAEPVGSRTVARKYGLGVSPATIRNEMADLEDMGYLEQPHTSAGRVPSDKGYRFYVDVLTPEQAAVDVDAGAVRALLSARAQRVDAVIRQAARLLAEWSEVLAVASQPAAQEERLAALQVVPLRGNVGLLVLVADDGRVSTRLVEFHAPPDPLRLDRLSRMLSSRLAGATLQTLARRVEDAVGDVLGPYPELAAEVAALFGEPGDAPGGLVLEGAANLLKQPEFRQVAKANQILEALQRDDLLEERLGRPDPETCGVQVSIGREIQVEEMAECSIVTAVYATPAGVLGRIGVLGPRRMAYGRIMAIVETVAQGVTAALGGPSFAGGFRPRAAELRAVWPGGTGGGQEAAGAPQGTTPVQGEAGGRGEADGRPVRRSEGGGARGSRGPRPPAGGSEWDRL
jgi:heat-inducible transcriptional repressor